MPLSDVAIRKAKPTDKPQRLFDGGGLYLEVSPAGGKLWRWKYRHGGKEKRMAFGVYPDVSLKACPWCFRRKAGKPIAEGCLSCGGRGCVGCRRHRESLPRLSGLVTKPQVSGEQTPQGHHKAARLLSAVRARGFRMP